MNIFNSTQAVRESEMEGIQVIYKDIRSPRLGLEGRYKTHQDTTRCREDFQGREMKSPSPPPMMEVFHANEPALVKGVDKPTKWGTLT